MSQPKEPGEGTQCARILAHLRAGHSLTPLEALSMFGSLRLAARIDDLKADGFVFDVTMVKRNGKKFASYRLRTPQLEMAL